MTTSRFSGSLGSAPRPWFLLVIALIPICQGAEPLVVKTAAPAPEIDALFERTDGWIGGDGAYSVALSTDKTLWLFSDTWVGKVRDGRRLDAALVNNTIGVQERGGRLIYAVGKGRDAKPSAMILPADGRGWFWLQAGTIERGKLSIFLNQLEKTDDPGVFGFRSVGLWLGTVAEADKAPESWRVEQVKMPNVVFSKERTLAWGSSVLRVGEDLYVYGFDERRGKGAPDRRMVVARVPAASIGDFAAWRYYCDGGWVEDHRNPSRLASEIGTEYSVAPLGKRYLAVYTQQGLSPRIMGRTADHPWGPWSTPVVLYECPEMARDKKLFCYGAKAHPSMSSGREAVVSYFVNSFEISQVVGDAKLYWPRFVRVTLAGGE